MGTPVDFCGANRTLNPAKGDEGNVIPMRVHISEHGIISRWKLTPAEKAHVERTGEVWIQMATRSAPPPVFVSGFPLMQILTDDGIPQLYDPDEGLKPETGLQLETDPKEG